MLRELTITGTQRELQYVLTYELELKIVSEIIKYGLLFWSADSPKINQHSVFPNDIHGKSTKKQPPWEIGIFIQRSRLDFLIFINCMSHFSF